MVIGNNTLFLSFIWIANVEIERKLDIHSFGRGGRGVKTRSCCDRHLVCFALTLGETVDNQIKMKLRSVAKDETQNVSHTLRCILNHCSSRISFSVSDQWSTCIFFPLLL